jgi:AcrR family transcriptional regulator
MERAGTLPDMSATQPAVFRSLPETSRAIEQGTMPLSPRARLLGAMLDAVAQRGYASTTVADVVTLACTSRRAFYEHFSDKDAAYLEAYAFAADLLFERLEAAQDLPSLLETYLATLATVPPVASAFVLEVRTASPEARERHRQMVDRFAELLPQAPSHLRIAAVGAIEELVSRSIRDGRTEQLPELRDALVEIVERLLG